MEASVEVTLVIRSPSTTNDVDFSLRLPLHGSTVASLKERLAAEHPEHPAPDEQVIPEAWHTVLQRRTRLNRARAGPARSREQLIPTSPRLAFAALDIRWPATAG